MPSNHDTPITRAIISVSDKSRLTELGQALAGHGVEILSTGGSAKALAEAKAGAQDDALSQREVDFGELAFKRVLGAGAYG